MQRTAEQAIDTFANATEENQAEPWRQGQVVHLPAEGELWIAGDLHDHRRNFDKLLRLVDLPNHPERHLILQELIHGEHVDPTGAEESWMTLLRAAELKCDFPNQVHFLLANHDLAQIYGEGIMKGGLDVCQAFKKGLKKAFTGDYRRVDIGMSEFLLSFPLAARCANGIFCCHSLPTDQQIESYDYTVFDRALTGVDYARKTGPAYQLIWGRNTTAAGAEAFAAALSVNVFITGHQPQDSGFATVGERQLIIASDHNQGVFLNADLSQSYDLPGLVRRLKKFVAVELD